MGGGYGKNDNILHIISSIRSSAPSASIYCVSGQALSKITNVTWLSPSPNIEKLLANCDVCINGGGLIKYEAAFCCIPTASFSTTKLQDEDTQLLAKSGFISNLGLDDSQESICLADMLEKPEIRENLVMTCSKKFNTNSSATLLKNYNQCFNYVKNNRLSTFNLSKSFQSTW